MNINDARRVYSLLQKTRVAIRLTSCYVQSGRHIRKGKTEDLVVVQALFPVCRACRLLVVVPTLLEIKGNGASHPCDEHQVSVGPYNVATPTRYRVRNLFKKHF